MGIPFSEQLPIRRGHRANGSRLYRKE